MLGFDEVEVEFLKARFEFFPGFKFNHGAGGDDHVGLRLVRVAPNAAFAHLHLEDPKVPQLDVSALREGIRNRLKRQLDRLPHHLLRVVSPLIDIEHDISLGEVACHEIAVEDGSLGVEVQVFPPGNAEVNGKARDNDMAKNPIFGRLLPLRFRRGKVRG